MGLDLSLTGTGCVVLDENLDVVFFDRWGEKLKRKSTTRERVERLIYITSKIIKCGRRYVYNDDQLFVGIEGYAFGAKGAQSDLGELHGATKTQLLLALKIVPDIIVSSHARLIVLKKGRFSKGKKGKGEIIDAVGSLGFSTDDENIADAYVIARCLCLEKNNE